MNRWVKVVLLTVCLLGQNKVFAENLVIYSCQNITLVNKLIAAFKQKNPAVKIEVFQFSPSEMKKTLDKEFSIGASPIADMIFATDINLLEEYKTYQRLISFPEIDTKVLYPEITDQENFYFPTKLINLVLFCHQNSAVRVKSWNHLIQDGLKNKVALPSPIDSPALALQYTLLYQKSELGKSFFQRLKDNNCAFLENSASCLNSILLEQTLYGIHYDHVLVRSILKDQLPLKIVYPTEGVLPLTEPVAVFKGTKGEKVARAFIEYILSVEGQKIITANGYLSCRKDVLSPLGFPSARDIKFIHFQKDALINGIKNFPKDLHELLNVPSLSSQKNVE